MKFVFSCGAVVALILAAATTGVVNATILPASLFTDNAVLQQKQSDPVWGAADPNEPISASINGQTVTTTAGSDGKWLVRFKPIDAGGPYTLTIAGLTGDKVTLKNILVGEVWVCSGQSNMQYAMSWNPNPTTAATIAAAADPMLHFFIVKNAVGLTPQSSVNGAWTIATPDSVPSLTAVGYYFGRDLRKALNVPVGLIHDNVGGTPAQAWTSREALAAIPSLKHYLDDEAAYPGRYPAMLDLYNRQQAAYLEAKGKYDTDAAAAKAAGTPIPTPPTAPSRPAPYEKWGAGAAHLYNGMIAPIVPYGIRGVIWYQGESNAGSAYEYQTLFPTLIRDWRSNWGQGDFPFLFVQLAPFDWYKPISLDPVDSSSWAELREAQRLTLSQVSNTAMAVTTDLGDRTTVHPQRKEPVGDRLSLAARALVYGQKVEYTGPVLVSTKLEGAALRITFSHAEGLHAIEVRDGSDSGEVIASADKLTGFEIAGSDKKYYRADATIAGSTVVLSSPNVPMPVAARYAWANYDVGNLSNGAGLPASPFTTDDWAWSTAPKSPAIPAK